MFEFIFDPYTEKLLIIQTSSTKSGYIELYTLSKVHSVHSETLSKPIITNLPANSVSSLAFAVAPNGDLFAIQRGHGTTMDILAAKHNYKTSSRMDAAIWTDHNWAFAINANRDLFAIKKQGEGNPSMTEVHILKSSSNYQTFDLQTPTGLPPTDDTWVFGLATNNDVFAIKKSKTTQAATEVHTLNGAARYVMGNQYVTCLPQTFEDYFFTFTRDRDLIAIKLDPGTTNPVFEISILDAASGYKSYKLKKKRVELELTDKKEQEIIPPSKEEVPITPTPKVVPPASLLTITRIPTPFWRQVAKNPYILLAAFVIGIGLFIQGKRLTDDPYIALGLVFAALGMVGLAYKASEEYRSVKIKVGEVSDELQSLLKELKETARTTKDAVKSLKKLSDTTEELIVELWDETSKSMVQLRGSCKQVADAIARGIPEGRFKPEAKIDISIEQLGLANTKWCSVM